MLNILIVPFSQAETKESGTCCDVLVVRVEFDGVDLDLRLPFREEVRDVDVGVGN